MFTFYPEEAFLKPPENPIIYAWSILFFLNMLKPNFHLWLIANVFHQQTKFPQFD